MKILQITILAFLLFSTNTKGAAITIDKFTEDTFIFTAHWNSDHYGEIATVYLPVDQYGPSINPRMTLEELTWQATIELNFNFLNPGQGSHFISILFPMNENTDYDDPDWWRKIDRKAMDATIYFDGTQIRKVPDDPYALQFVYAAPDTGGTLTLLLTAIPILLFCHQRRRRV